MTKQATKAAAPANAPVRSLMVKFATRYGVDADKMNATLKATAFKTKQGDPEVTNEQMLALLVVADQHGLNPFTKEIFAFPDGKGGIVPMVPVDGWISIINSRPELEAIEFRDADAGEGEVLPWIECSITRKDRSKPIVVREYFAECKRNTQPWQSHPRRMLRHKALIQCARIAFGFAGIYDPDEGERIRDANAIDSTATTLKPATQVPRELPAPSGGQENTATPAAPAGATVGDEADNPDLFPKD